MWAALPRRQGSSVSRRPGVVRPRRRRRRCRSSALVDPEPYDLVGAVVPRRCRPPADGPHRCTRVVCPCRIRRPQAATHAGVASRHGIWSSPSSSRPPLQDLHHGRSMASAPTLFPPPSRLPDLCCRQVCGCTALHCWTCRSFLAQIQGGADLGGWASFAVV
ncbi:hypothetical protein EJB05_45111 [Eragrostis curvula]|uniref:Uncharacterized protein n=1 Tax=Eragrostis curvula TaxID=38414 RepID=A0A5J9TJH2_9POAL|nr:hypothetical protein EJB05_45111 [Eragrostis curvula]